MEPWQRKLSEIKEKIKIHSTPLETILEADLKISIEEKLEEIKIEKEKNNH